MNDTLTHSVQRGSRVAIEYSLSLEDGTVVETTDDAGALEFVIGDGTLIEALENVLLNMKTGERQCVSLDPREAFGFRDETNIHHLPRSEFSEDMPLEPGLIIGFSTPSGDEVPGMVLKVLDEEVAVDFNHPLSGHSITFDVEVKSVIRAES